MELEISRGDAEHRMGNDLSIAGADQYRRDHIKLIDECQRLERVVVGRDASIAELERECGNWKDRWRVADDQRISFYRQLDEEIEKGAAQARHVAELEREKAEREVLNRVWAEEIRSTAGMIMACQPHIESALKVIADRLEPPEPVKPERPYRIDVIRAENDWRWIINCDEGPWPYGNAEAEDAARADAQAVADRRWPPPAGTWNPVPRGDTMIVTPPRKQVKISLTETSAWGCEWRLFDDATRLVLREGREKDKRDADYEARRMASAEGWEVVE